MARTGCDALGVDWPNQGSQYLRFVQLLKICDFGQPISLNDFGCGYGALLEYLASHAGRVLSRTMIIEHVWDESFEGLTNIVDVYVRHLRSKVDDPFPTKLIRTVRGAGYSIGEEVIA